MRTPRCQAGATEAAGASVLACWVGLQAKGACSTADLPDSCLEPAPLHHACCLLSPRLLSALCSVWSALTQEVICSSHKGLSTAVTCITTDERGICWAGSGAQLLAGGCMLRGSRV